MRIALSLVVLVSCGGDDPPAGVDAPGGDGAPVGDAPIAPFDPLVGIGDVALVDDGYQFTEGPQWRDDAQDLLFTDIPANRIYRYVPGGGAPASFRDDSNNANGLAVAGAGVLLAAEHGSRSVTRTEGDAITTIAATFEGRRLSSPNDVIHTPAATYFTDPPFGISDAERELDFIGVFRIAADGTLFAEHRGALSARPNGIGVSPDRTTLYVADTADGNLYKFAIDPATGALGPRAVHAPTTGGADGLAIDVGGNIFVTTRTGVEVFAPDGARWGVIDVPQQPSNCAFGDADHRTLYITARSGLYSVRLANPGLPDR